VPSDGILAELYIRAPGLPILHVLLEGVLRGVIAVVGLIGRTARRNDKGEYQQTKL
jgi:hypothetical protein